MKGKFGILLGAGFLVLSTIAAATGNFAVRLDLAAKQNAAGTQTASTDGTTSNSIGIRRISLTQAAATGFGQFQARSNVIAPGTPFHIYFEPTNLATRFENGNIRASMSVDILVRNSQGQTVAVRDNAWQLPLTRASAGPAPLTQVYGDLMLNHLTFPEGSYKVVLRIHDDLNGTFVDQTLDIELRQQAVRPGQRLSQANPTR
ncbi:MAG: hypothetical protein AB7L90_01250 [Hyphomicrobiaceae bacterium]